MHNLSYGLTILHVSLASQCSTFLHSPSVTEDEQSRRLQPGKMLVKRSRQESPVAVRQSCRLFLQESKCQQLHGDSSALWMQTALLSAYKWRGTRNHAGPTDLNEPDEAHICIDGTVRLVAHCSPDYRNRRQRWLLRASPRLFTGCYLIPAVPSWCLVETRHPSPGTALNHSNESPVGKIME